MTAPKTQHPEPKTVKDRVAEGFAERQQQREQRRQKQRAQRESRDKDWKPVFFEGRGLV